MKTKHETVKTATGGQIKELASALVEAIPSNIAANKAQYWIGKKKKLAEEIRKILFGNNCSNYPETISDWQSFYKEVFGMILDFSNVSIPEKPTKGKWRLLIITDITITLETFYAKCKEKFSCRRWTNDNLDKIVIYNERDAKSGPYAIWVRDEVEADENFKNKSANDIKAMGVKTETLAERLIHELKFFQETGSHLDLDIDQITLCSGSRYADGGVPCVNWNDGKVLVSWRSPDDADDYLRSRQAVS